MSDKPVIFLAFANEQTIADRYLRGLAKEQALIKEAIEPAEDNGLCELIVESNATVNSIIKYFQKQKYRDRIAIFHYGGHADGYQLLLESLDNENVVAHGEGLVSFFSKQQGLKLIFLNGCSTQQQALDLTNAGIPAVIGTSQSIDDDVATRLAVRFYKGIGQGNSIDRSWREAEDEIKIRTGSGINRSMFRGGFEFSELVLDRFPWDIHYREGSEIVKAWNLPDAGNNPLFGLPDIPEKYGLPSEPFRYLNSYEREHAHLFFGRSRYINALYSHVTDPKGPPIVLLYGQSGAGKSSLLDAGLVPRLENRMEVIYVHQDQKKSLLETLRAALGVSQKRLQLRQLQIMAEEFDDETKGQFSKIIHNIQSKDSDAGEPEADLTDQDLDQFAEHGSLLKIWKSIEAKTGKPLIIMLDQVAGMYTNSHDHTSASQSGNSSQEQKREFEGFLSALKSVFDSSGESPKGKLILSYRKEYHPEIDEQFRQERIPRTAVYIEPLGQGDIIEICSAFSKTTLLRKKYNIQIEEGLPEAISQDLTSSPDAVVAPVLQIILSKLWHQAKHTQSENPLFTFAQYQKLREGGIEMRDFFRQQMLMLERDSRVGKLVKSGLALDLLHYHVNALGISESRRMEDVEKRYSHHGEEIEALVQACSELSILKLTNGNGKVTLAHDILAPVVDSEYNDSDKPAQRASRILTAKMDDKRALERKDEQSAEKEKSSQSVYLGEADLAVVESGLDAIPALSKEENDILTFSRQMREKRQRERQRNRRIRNSLVAVIILGSIIFGIFQRNSAIKIREANTDRSQKNIVRAGQEIDRLNYSEAFDLIKESFEFIKEIPDYARNFLAELAFLHVESSNVLEAEQVLRTSMKTLPEDKSSSFEDHIQTARRSLEFEKDSSMALENLREAMQLLCVDGQQTLLMEKYYPALVPVKGGQFTMGFENTSKDERTKDAPLHDIIVSDFELGKYEVTVGQYNLFCMDDKWPMPEPTATHWIQDHPMVAVSWYMATAYCNWLSKKQGMNKVYSYPSQSDEYRVEANWNANGYRLPTEAEWEYAAGGGEKVGSRPLYSGSNSLYPLDSVAWYDENANSTHPVGEKIPNTLGIYDLTGNVREWCWDKYDEDYYNVSPNNNPKGPAPLNIYDSQVVRGGAWNDDDIYLNIRFRNKFWKLEDDNVVIGFRVARSISD